jgi:hypothetical protein
MIMDSIYNFNITWFSCCFTVTRRVPLVELEWLILAGTIYIHFEYYYLNTILSKMSPYQSGSEDPVKPLCSRLALLLNFSVKSSPPYKIHRSCWSCQYHLYSVANGWNFCTADDSSKLKIVDGENENGE